MGCGSSRPSLTNRSRPGRSVTNIPSFPGRKAIPHGCSNPSTTVTTRCRDSVKPDGAGGDWAGTSPSGAGQPDGSADIRTISRTIGTIERLALSISLHRGPWSGAFLRELLSTIELPSQRPSGLCGSERYSSSTAIGDSRGAQHSEGCADGCGLYASSSRCNESFRAERHHWVDARRTPGRQVASHESDDRENADHANERLRIARGHAEEQPRSAAG